MAAGCMYMYEIGKENDANNSRFACSIIQETKEIVHLHNYTVPGKPDIPATICQAACATSAATSFLTQCLSGHADLRMVHLGLTTQWMRWRVKRQISGVQKQAT